MTRAWRCGQGRRDVLASAADAAAAHVHAHGVRRRQRLSRVLQRGGGRRGDGRDGHGARGVVPHGGRAAHHVRVAVPICEVGRLEVAGRGRGSVHGRGGGGGGGGGNGALLVVVMMVVMVLQEVVVRGVVRLGGGCGGRRRRGNLVRRGRVVVQCRRRREVRRLRRWGRRQHRRRGYVVALLGHTAAEGRHGGHRVVACARVGNRLVVAVVCEDRVFAVDLGNKMLFCQPWQG